MFRGENAHYPTISSSLLRKDNSILLKEQRFDFYENVVNGYYDEIATNITAVERKIFLVFSQHHGLATNLIDLTTSPLVALYLTCTKTNTKQKIMDIYI